MSSAKTIPTGEDPQAFLANVAPDRRRAEAQALDALFRSATGYQPEIWVGGLVGYGRYSYTYDSGRSGTFLATGFAMRKAAISIYIMPGYADFEPLLERLGPHKKGAACLYVTRLARIDSAVLGELVAAGLADLGTRWDISPT